MARYFFTLSDLSGGRLPNRNAAAQPRRRFSVSAGSYEEALTALAGIGETDGDWFRTACVADETGYRVYSVVPTGQAGVAPFRAVVREVR